MTKALVKSLCVATCLICLVSNASTTAVPRQNPDNARLRDITSTINRVLKKNWKVEGADVADASLDDFGFQGYLIEIDDPTKTYEEEHSGKFGTKTKVSYHPFYKLFLVSLSRSRTAEKVRAEVDKARNSPRQEDTYAFYGSNATYALLYQQSDQTNWRGGLKTIADAFGIAAAPPRNR